MQMLAGFGEEGEQRRLRRTYPVGSAAATVEARSREEGCDIRTLGEVDSLLTLSTR